MVQLLHAIASAFSPRKPTARESRVNVFSVVHGKRASIEKLGTQVKNTKCSGQCTCRCCK